VRAHFVDQLSERELANLTAALSNIDIDGSRAAGGCDEAEPGADPEARTVSSRRSRAGGPEVGAASSVDATG
jgi:hypothetical protein